MKIALLLILLSWSTISWGQIVVAVSEIPKLLSYQKNEQGIYNKFLEQFSDISLLYLPPKRTEFEFLKDYIDCLFPASKNTMTQKLTLIESLPVQQIGAYLFTRNGAAKFSELDKPRVAIRRGFTYGNVLANYQFEYVELATDVETARFLSLGRVDGIIGYLPDVEAAHDRLKLSIPDFDKDNPVYTANDAFVCKVNSETEEFINRVNHILSK